MTDMIQTDYGAYPAPSSIAAIMQKAKRNSDGGFDRRTACWRVLKRYQYIADLTAQLAYVKGVEPTMPEAEIAA